MGLLKKMESNIPWFLIICAITMVIGCKSRILTDSHDWTPHSVKRTQNWNLTSRSWSSSLLAFLCFPTSYFWVQVACGDDHTVCLTELGQILAFGGGHWRAGEGQKIHQKNICRILKIGTLKGTLPILVELCWIETVFFQSELDSLPQVSKGNFAWEVPWWWIWLFKLESLKPTRFTTELHFGNLT
jgi:hypothetical protein